MILLKSLLLVMLIASWIYWLIAWRSLGLFFRRPASPRGPHGIYHPKVSILKPIKGVDADAYENFISFWKQEYPDYELLFGVNDPNDPAIPLVEQLQRQFPDRDIRLFRTPPLGANPKVAVLAHLAQHACGEVLVLSDADIRVGPEYLRHVVDPLADPRIGLVTCLYRGSSPQSLAARLESLLINTTFLPSVIVASRVMRMPVGLGATLAVRRGDLEALGGFVAIADYLADDLQLAARIVTLGLKTHLSSYVVSSILGDVCFRDQWDRELRWERTIRVSYPWRYPGLLLTFCTPLAVSLLLFPGLWPLSGAALIISITLRWIVAGRALAGVGDRLQLWQFLWLPLRDLLTAVIWCAGLLGNKIIWRGQTLRVLPDGTLKAALAGGPFRRGIRALDAWLRRRQGIIEYTADPQCMLRIAPATAGAAVELSDGTRITPGERLVELHFWNEQMPPIPPGGPDIAWAAAAQSRMQRSLRELAAYLESDGQFKTVQALRGEGTFVAGRNGNAQVARMLRRFGFEIVPQQPRGFWQQCHDLPGNLLLWGLLWTFQPGTLGGKPLRRPRQQVWMSRKTLERKYGARPPVESAC